MNLQERFYQAMSRNSRAASTSEARVTEMVNGLLVSKPAKEPVVIDLQEYARSGKAGCPASVPGININKLKVIQDFINRRY